MGSASLGLPATLGHYRVVEKIGAGGMGEVYLARDERLERDVAIKVLPPGAIADEVARKRFRKEALALSRLNHPNIETIFDFDSDNGLDFIATEYVPGEGLDQKLAAGALTEKEIARFGSQLADGLAAAHDQGIVHRDLKPANLRITPDGRLKILDFGIAKLTMPVSFEAATESLTENTRLAGTLPYMAPEQVRGEKLDARTDIWAAGVVLYEMATGHRPFRAPGLQVTDQILHQAPAAPSSTNRRLSPALDAVVLKCLDKDTDNRYQSVRELAVDLRRMAMPTAAATAAASVPRRQVSARTLFITAAVVVVTILAAAATYFYFVKKKPAAAASQITSLAVLPLTNLSGDPSQEYFADGMTEVLITDLSKIKALKVISRTSVMRFKATKKPLPEIARELGVDGIIEGSVLRSGDRVRITAQLINAATDMHVWADNFDRDLRDVLVMQSEVARAIAQQVRVAVSPAEQQQLASARPVNPEAYDLFLKGQYFLSKDNPEGVLKAIQYFQRAVDLDTTYAPAHAGLSVAYATAGLYGVLPFKDVLPKAKVAAKRAVGLDDSSAGAHVALGIVMHYDRDWAGAGREFKRALELDPNNVVGTYAAYGKYLTDLGRFDEAIVVRRRAVDLDPFSISAKDFLGWTLYYAGHYDESIRQYLKLIEMEPRNAYYYMWLSSDYLAIHASAETIAACRKALELGPEDQTVLTICGHNLALSGRRQEAVAVLERVQAISLKTPVDPCMLAYLYVGLGDKERALGLLERAFEERSPNMTQPAPDFPQLASEPRFQDLLRRMNLPQ